MNNTTIITAEVHADQTYYTAIARGVAYCAHEIDDRWFVSSNRLGLGRFNAGGGKYYDTLADVAKGCKAFVGLDVLLSH